jgi:hypothetical protein
LAKTNEPLDAEQEIPRESPCGLIHATIEEALVHAELNLGMRDGKSNRLVKDLKPVLSGQLHLDGTVIGWQSSSRQRFRLDWDQHYAAKDGSKGTQGVHVNEEDFDRQEARQKVCHPTESTLRIAEQYWRRWSAPFGKRTGAIMKEDLKNYSSTR